MKKELMIIAAAFAVVGACQSCKPTAKGIDTANLNTEVAPGADFYEYACGGWMKANPLPAEFSRFGSFDALGEISRKQVRDLVESLASDTTVEAGTNAQKIRDLFNLGMDSATLNEQGAAPIIADIELINATPREKFVDIMATLPGVDIFFGTGVMADLMNSNMNTMYWSQGGLGLGDRDYYTDETDRAKGIREAYRTYLTTIAKLVGYDAAAATRLMENTMAIETEIAKTHLTRTEQRDLSRQYNPMTVAELGKSYPSVDLKRYFELMKLDVDTVIVDNPASYATVDKVLRTADIQALRDYAVASYIGSAASYLSDNFIDAAFELRKVMSGVQEKQPRWKRALSVPNGILSEALGEVYVEKYFPASSKEKMLTLVGNLQKALGQHIENLTWMSDTTKARAIEKLEAFTVKIGYPDKWRDYSALTIDPKLSYWKNMQNAIVFNLEYNCNDYGKPVDRERWLISPQTVNAYYMPTTNEICFPAAILQPPFFDAEADDAINYGAIGVVIGHEMTHGFDDQGRAFDKDGNMINWWSEADAEAFNALADKIVEQFNQVEVAEGVKANGRLTLGENIADQGGLRVAYTAYHNSLNGAEAPVIDGFTPDQRFYLAYANVWAANIRPEEVLSRTESDPHSLGRWRVNATLRNIEPFFKAFDVKEGDAMFRPEEERVVIW